MSDIVATAANFEDFGHENGFRFWWASEFSRMLGYPDSKSFMPVINRAIKACMSANINDYFDDFRKEQRIVDGLVIDDIKLSRFACYMVAMNANPKKEQVARAQVYFADQVEKINILLENNAEIERIHIRDEIKLSHTSLNSAASQCGVSHFGLFHDAGYRGLYNRGIKDVKAIKGIKQNDDHFEFMGSTELAANLFRITLTEEQLKKSNVSDEKHAMYVHNVVGKDIRAMVIKNTGLSPEQLPTERRLSEVKKDVKKAKALNKQDQKKLLSGKQ